VSDAAAALDGLDILVVNTGGPPKGALLDIADSDWNEQFQNLLLSSIQLFRSAFPLMKAEGWGRCIVVGSVAAREPIDGLTVSNILRAGILGLINTASRQFAAAGVTVNAILPGYIDTERLREVSKDIEGLATQIPVGRIASIDEVGQLAAYLASVQAGYLTGQAITLDGGLSRSI
jgi:3-oxoacyl-[acyl-carrier protein] reductase